MLYIVHGDDLLSSRNRLSELSTGRGNVTFLNAEKISLSDIVQAFSSSDLFLDKKCIVIEKVLKLPKKEMEKLIEIVSLLDQSTTVIFWHNTELSKVFLSKWKSAQVEGFLLPKLFFTFLDELSPENVRKSLALLSQMPNVEAEQIFYAMIKRIRILMLLKSNVNSDEIVKMNSWQLQKIQVQSRRWTIEELEKTYKELFVLEVKMKSGGLMLPLKKHLDILLVSELH